MTAPEPPTIRRAHCRMAYLVTRSPQHIGCGEALGDVDQPVLRNPVTRTPCIPASAIKRSLRDHAGLGDELAALLLGTDGGRAGHLAPQEAQLLWLPVPRASGGVAWVTSPSLLVAHARQAQRCGSEGQVAWPLATPAPGEAWVTTPPGNPPHVEQLLDYPLAARLAPDALPDALRRLASEAFAPEPLAWRDAVAARVMVVHDAMLVALAQQLDVRTRNAVGPDGVAINLWREETVPEDTVFCAPLAVYPLSGQARSPGEAEAATWLSALANAPLLLQLGGNASLGHGWTLLHLGGHHTAPAAVVAHAA